jgi:hypothetical protein
MESFQKELFALGKGVPSEVESIKRYSIGDYLKLLEYLLTKPSTNTEE